MIRSSLLSLSLFAVWVAIGSATETEALALLKGIENERMKYDCFHIRYDETRRDEDNKTVTQEVDFDHGKMRKFHLKNDRFAGWVEVLNGDEFLRYECGDGADVRLMSSHSDQAKYSGRYDPRILGLADFMIPPLTVKDCLLYGRIQGFSVENTTLEGKSVKCVSAVENDRRWDFYIEEPGFRLLKKVYSSPTINTTITNRYDDPKLGPFPSEIKIFRTDGEKIVFDRTIKVTSFEVKTPFPSDTFTYQGMNLPLNTAIVDYRINRRLGYWDGEKLVEKPVSASAQEMRDWEKRKRQQPLGSAVRYIMMGLGAAMIVYAAVLKIRKHTNPS